MYRFIDTICVLLDIRCTWYGRSGVVVIVSAFAAGGVVLRVKLMSKTLTVLSVSSLLYEVGLDSHQDAIMATGGTTLARVRELGVDRIVALGVPKIKVLKLMKRINEVPPPLHEVDPSKSSLENEMIMSAAGSNDFSDDTDSSDEDSAGHLTSEFRETLRGMSGGQSGDSHGPAMMGLRAKQGARWGARPAVWMGGACRASDPCSHLGVESPPLPRPPRWERRRHRRPRSFSAKLSTGIRLRPVRWPTCQRAHRAGGQHAL